MNPIGWAKAFGRFWWDFIIGDDWTVAVAVAVGLGATAVLLGASVDAWWVLPAIGVTIVGLSLRRTTRERE